MTAHAPRACLRGLACILAALSGPAGAVGLGELRVHSSIGEVLEVTVVLSPAPEERLRPDCFSLGRVPAGGLPAVGRATFAVEPDAGGWRLRIRTRTVVGEPALLLRLNAACENKTASSRDYEILLDPRPDPGPPPAFRSVAGDTLASLATAIYPRSRAVRDAYVEALRAANPPIAGLGSDEAIPAGTEIVLPDLKRFSLSFAVTPPAPRVALPAPPRREPAAPPPATAPPRAAALAVPATGAREPDARKSEPKPAPARPPAVPKPPPPATAAPDTAKAPVAPAPARPVRAPNEGAFVLRLSSPAMDLDRSRGIDEGKRAVLRERLLILDADDQVSALLAMRNSLKQLEGRVAELQLKLSALPPTAPTASPAAEKFTPAAPAKPGTAAPAKLETAAPAKSGTAAPAKPETAAPAKPETAVAPAPASQPPMVAAPAEKKPAAKPAATGPAAAPPAGAAPPVWLWVALALALAAIAAGAVWWALRRRRTMTPVVATAPAPQTSALDEAAVLMQGAAAGEPPSPGHRVVADSDASLATHIPGADPTALRRRYIAERFPEISGGTIAPGDPDSVVKAARLFYEDGAIARAIELLQFTVEEDPAAMKPWLALFEIFRLERLTGEFSELARRFREHHGESENWRKVQYIGREIDPQNPLYRDAGFNSLETIGYPAAKKDAPVTFDPLAENWLNAPMDFTTDALAANLRAGLLADAGITDSELAADPMPALKNVEVFNVA